MFVDSHSHLDSPELYSELDAVLIRAEEAQVHTILTIGCLNGSQESISRFLQLLERSEGIYGGLGVHPHDAQIYEDIVGEEIQEYLKHSKIVGWGEIGLDFHYKYSPRKDQIEAFRDQLRRARSVDCPVIIHMREAEELTCQILEEEFSGGPGAVVHCFTAELEIAERCLQQGFYLSFGGILTFQKSDNLRSVARQIPLDRVLIETDSPYLAPVPFRGKRNEPAYVVKVAEMLGQIHEKSTEEIAAITESNFKELFRI